MPSPSGGTLTIFWDNWVTTAGIMQAPHKIAEAYIQPVPYRTDETVKSDLNRLMLLVDDTQILISGQAHARYPYGVAYR